MRFSIKMLELSRKALVQCEQDHEGSAQTVPEMQGPDSA